mmetsp:Transcript_54826/g.172064  ORF Transcript_54826/g.172064 Transcript_54826/m.172064 type:complete len:261 (-) Transcript_54826:120-902(-)
MSVPRVLAGRGGAVLENALRRHEELEVRPRVPGPEAEDQGRVGAQRRGPRDGEADDEPGVGGQDGLREHGREGECQEPAAVRDAARAVEDGIATVVLDRVRPAEVRRVDAEQEHVSQDERPATRRCVDVVHAEHPRDGIVGPQLEEETGDEERTEQREHPPRVCCHHDVGDALALRDQEEQRSQDKVRGDKQDLRRNMRDDAGGAVLGVDCVVSHRQDGCGKPEQQPGQECLGKRMSGLAAGVVRVGHVGKHGVRIELQR